MGDAGRKKIASEMWILETHQTHAWARRVAHSILAGFFILSSHGAFAERPTGQALPSWDADESGDNYYLGGGLWPNRLVPDGGASAPPRRAANTFYGPSETFGDTVSRVLPQAGNPLDSARDGFRSVHGLDDSADDLVGSAEDLSPGVSSSDSGIFSDSGLGANTNPGGAPGLGRGPFAGLGNLFQGGNGGMMNSLLQGLAFFSMLQDLFSSFSSAGAQFNASNTGRSALMAATNLLGVAAGNGGTTSPFGGSNSFTNLLGANGSVANGLLNGDFIPGGPLNHSAARDFINNTIGSRGSTSDCASFGRRLVGALTGSNYFDQGLGITGTPYASMGGQYLKGSGLYSELPVDPGSYQDGDTRIYQGGSGGKGHWETYYQGSWYSDHRQNSAYTHNIGSYYSGAKVYRLR